MKLLKNIHYIKTLTMGSLLFFGSVAQADQHYTVSRPLFWNLIVTGNDGSYNVVISRGRDAKGADTIFFDNGQSFSADRLMAININGAKTGDHLYWVKPGISAQINFNANSTGNDTVVGNEGRSAIFAGPGNTLACASASSVMAAGTGHAIFLHGVYAANPAKGEYRYVANMHGGSAMTDLPKQSRFGNFTTPATGYLEGLENTCTMYQLMK